jgi:hypothetical protein
MRSQGGDTAEKLISVAALSIALELVLFKFLPDIGTATIQHNISTLADFPAFEQTYMNPGSVHHARFLGNAILLELAKWLAPLDHSVDPRLHPLRVAAGLLTPLYAYIGVHFVLWRGNEFAWRDFLAPYGLAVLIGMYVFYPADMPALASLSIAVYLVLRGKRPGALLLMLVTGLFRESAFHLVWLVAAWGLCDRSRPVTQRVAWAAAFALAFVAEYELIRHFFPGPLSAAGGVILDPRVLFLEPGLLSLTTLCSLGLALLFPLACVLRCRALPRGDWRRDFFLLNCWIFPAWIVFYRMMSGNISEFRMLLPALLPCIYGFAWAGASRHSQDGTRPAPQMRLVEMPISTRARGDTPLQVLP